MITTYSKETFFSELEKNIIKDKSHVLYYKDGNQSKVRRAVPIVYVYDEPLPVEKINNDDIFDYISSTINENSSVINSLKDKMMMTEEFKIIFNQLIASYNNFFYTFYNFDNREYV